MIIKSSERRLYTINMLRWHEETAREERIGRKDGEAAMVSV